MYNSNYSPIPSAPEHSISIVLEPKKSTLDENAEPIAESKKVNNHKYFHLIDLFAMS